MIIENIFQNPHLYSWYYLSVCCAGVMCVIVYLVIWLVKNRRNKQKQ